MSTNLPPGTILGNRFAVVGALGSGGTATVYLVVDQLRGERIALKVVHPHLASDPATQRRLRREVNAATLVAHDAALVPYDLHELDGHLALSMPYHPGQTLTEVVSAEGPLPPDKVRTLGIRIAEALATAHRSGLLHRDVTGNNILLESGDQAVLTDFGLSRVESQATRSTGMLGTAGYAAPEVYSGERSDPRADLYGLGCALYLAATGETPFGTDTPMAALQRQLEESYTPVQQRSPSIPDDVARTIEALLRKDPADRPQGAREVADALRAGVPAGEELDSPVSTGGTRGAAASGSGRKAHLKPGNWAVLVREHDEDRARRRQLRVDARKERKTLETEVSRRARELMNGVLAYVGLHSEDDPTPEDLLVQAVVDEARLPADAKLALPPAVLRKRFVLVEGVSEATAKRLEREVRTAGFKAKVGDTTPPDSARLSALFTALMVTGWVLTAFVGAYIDIRLWIAMMVGVTILVGRYNQTRPQLKVGDLPVAFGPDLTRWLDRPVAGTHPLDEASPSAERASERPAPQPDSDTDDAPLTRGQQLAQRVLRQLDALQTTIEELDLPTIAANDLRDTARDLEERALDLSDAIDRLDAELEANTEDGSWIEPRLARLHTKQRAGEPVDAAEIDRLESALASHQASEALLAQLDSQLTQATAELLEIASTATRVRRELLAEPEPTQTATRALDRLREEAAHADAARRELQKRAAQRSVRR